MTAMIEAVRPRFLIPVHGETRHLHLHAALAQKAGLAERDVFILKNGDAWCSDGERAWQDMPVTAGDVLVDGPLVGEIAVAAMEERQQLSQDGFIVAVIRVNAHNRLAGEPEIISRGFIPAGELHGLVKGARREIRQHFRGGQAVADDRIGERLQDFFYRETKARPVVLPSIIRV
jgi:ribonuclease J